jgi:hypothetical protein
MFLLNVTITRLGTEGPGAISSADVAWVMSVGLHDNGGCFPFNVIRDTTLGNQVQLSSVVCRSINTNNAETREIFSLYSTDVHWTRTLTLRHNDFLLLQINTTEFPLLSTKYQIHI